MLWTDEADAHLIKLWKAGGSLTTVANEMGEMGYDVNRSKVAGRVHRLKKCGIDMTRQRSTRVTVIETPSPEPVTVEQLEKLIENPGVDYLDNSSDGCKALLDKRGHWGLPMCCGKRRGYDFNGAKSPYCPTHFRLYVNEQAARRACMAKAAKTVEVEITDRMANKFVRDILERFENIESARGTFMNKARREKEAMTTIYEAMAAKGVSQKSAKTNIKLIRLLEKAKALMADLEVDDRKMAMRLAKAQGDKKQLMLFGELPAIKGPTKAELREREREEKAEAEKEAKADNVVEMQPGAA